MRTIFWVVMVWNMYIRPLFWKAKSTVTIKDDEDNIFYTTTDLEQDIDVLIEKIKKDDIHFDYIVGVARGGLVPAVYLSHRLGIPMIPVSWSLTSGSRESNLWIPEDLLQGKKVLVVDDILDNGDTFSTLIEDWQASVPEDLPFENIKTATLIYNVTNGVFEADYFGRTIDRKEDQRWFCFPWENKPV